MIFSLEILYIFKGFFFKLFHFHLILIAGIFELQSYANMPCVLIAFSGTIL